MKIHGHKTDEMGNGKNYITGHSYGAWVSHASMNMYPLLLALLTSSMEHSPS